MCYYSLDFLVSYVVARLWSPAPNILLVIVTNPSFVPPSATRGLMSDGLWAYALRFETRISREITPLAG